MPRWSFRLLLALTAVTSGMALGAAWIALTLLRTHGLVGPGTGPIGDASRLVGQSVERIITLRGLGRQGARTAGPVADSLAAAAVRGALAALGDPYAELLTPQGQDDFRAAVGDHFSGIGVAVTLRDDSVTIGDLFPTGPAQAAGLRAGDRILRIDTLRVGVGPGGFAEAIAALRGAAHTKVRVEVRGPGSRDSVRRHVVTRAPVRAPAVPTALVMPDGTGYVALTLFGEESARELAQAVDSVTGAGARRLVLDLRENPGGHIETALSVGELFLPAGTLFAAVRTLGTPDEERLVTVQPPRFPDLPVAVLVGRETASAAEMLAGALQDHQRGTVVGERTYGKGSVQSVVPVERGFSLKLTTAHWFTPAGRPVDRATVAPGADQPSDTRPRLLPLTGPRLAPLPPVGADSVRTGGIVPDVAVRPDSGTGSLVAMLAQFPGDWSARVPDAVVAAAHRIRRTSSDAAVWMALVAALRHRQIALHGTGAAAFRAPLVTAVRAERARLDGDRAGAARLALERDPGFRAARRALRVTQHTPSARRRPRVRVADGARSDTAP